jgi:hypothetical protein
MTQGFFSLIQFCPDASRAEAVNVGLVLFQVEPAATVVRVVDDVAPIVKRLGRKDDTATVLSIVRSMKNRIEVERFGSVEALEKFARSRGNQVRLTLPRPMSIDDLTADLDAMFDELVVVPDALATPTKERAPTLLEKTFESLASRLPDRVFIRPALHVQSLGIALHPSFAYRNGRLNVVEEMPRSGDPEAMTSRAFALSKEGELVRHLEEGEGKLFVVSTATRQSAKTLEREGDFADILRKLGNAEFVPSARVPEFAKRIESDLAGH